MKKILIVITIIFYTSIYNICALEQFDVSKVTFINPYITYYIEENNTFTYPETVTVYTTDKQQFNESVSWDDQFVDWTTPGIYKVYGTIHNTEKYNGIPSIEMSIMVAHSILILSPLDITDQSITFSFSTELQYDTGLILDPSLIKIWMADHSQFKEDNTWHNVTANKDIHLTSTELTISHIDFQENPDQILKLQMSYNSKEYDHYSYPSRIFFDEELNQIKVRTESGGDRNGGNREDNPDVSLPEDSNNEIISPDEETIPIIKPPIIDNITTDETHQDIIDDIIISTEDKDITPLPQENHPSVILPAKKEIKVSSQSQITSQPQTTLDSTNSSNHSQDQTSTTQTDTSLSTAKNIVIESKPSFVIPFFCLVGIILGLITSRKKIMHEKE